MNRTRNMARMFDCRHFDFDLPLTATTRPQVPPAPEKPEVLSPEDKVLIRHLRLSYEHQVHCARKRFNQKLYDINSWGSIRALSEKFGVPAIEIHKVLADER